MAGTAAWRCFSVISGTSFVAGTGRVSDRHGAVARRAAAFAFELKEDTAHKGLHVKKEENGLQVFTEGSFNTGHWNTVLGNKELPASGRSYWEVKFLKKPTDAWEFIGVAEPTADVNVPLTRNRKGAGWFWGANWEDSFVYTYLPMRKEWNEQKIAAAMVYAQFAVDDAGQDKKEADRQALEQTKTHWTGPGIHVGQYTEFPKFRKGLVVGIDVDMDDGSLAFWADGKFLGIVRDTEGKPVNLKGRKVVPALSVFGRNTGMVKQNTIMEVRTDMEPPSRPKSK